MRPQLKRRHRPALLSTSLSLAVALAAAAAAAGRAAVEPPARPNLVLITLDTTRADHLGCYGWTHARTPNLDALARGGVLFERCDTAAPITLPSHATILTGLFPTRHGVRDNGTFVLPANVETVATRLRAAGYDTAAVVSAVVLARRYGLDRGFRLYDDDLGPSSAGGGAGAGAEANERTADATTAAAISALGKLRAPFFLWVHYFDPHEEYRPPERIARTMKGPHPLYDGEIAFADEQIGKLLEALPARTDVVAVADHGEMLGERGEPTHGLLLYAAARRVPLILAGPDVPAGRRAPCLVRTADIAPTLLSWAGLTSGEKLDGAPLLPLPAASAGAGDCGRTSYTESFLPFFAYHWSPARALSDGRQLFLRSPEASLYAIAEDPSETRDAAASQPDAVRTWDRRLDELLAAAGETAGAEISGNAPASGEEARKLLSLGYLAGGGGRVDPTLPDPRRRTDIAREIHEATRQMQQGRFADALPSLKSVLRRDPSNFTALTLAARCLQETGKCAEAVPLFQRASRENPRSEVPVVDAAGCLLTLGRKDEAMGEFRRALTLDPAQPESAANLARLLAEAGDRAAALGVLDAAIAAGSRASTVFLERGTLLAQSGRLQDAYASFREAVHRNPGDPLALENAARAAYQLGHDSEAVGLYEDLAKLVPSSETWRTMGAIYLSRLGDRANSLRCFREALRLELDPGIREEIRAVIAGLEDSPSR